jgi:hypothetical protein
MLEITATFFASVRDIIAKPVQLTFPELAEMMAEASAVPIHRLDKENAMCVVPARFAPLTRTSANVVERFAFTGDVDGGKPGDPGFDGVVRRLDDLGLAYIVHTTTKSTVTANRYRVIIPFSSPLTAEDSEAAWSSIDQLFGSIFDERTYEACRLSIMPRAWFGAPDPDEFTEWNEAAAHHALRYREGDPLDAHALMLAYPPAPAAFRQEDDATSATIVIPDADDVDFAELTDLDRSPLVTPAMVADYLSAPVGGRFFRFMCRVAGRALNQGVGCDEDTILSLGMAMNRRADNRCRPTARREARRALRYAVSRHGAANAVFKPRTHEDILNREIERLRRRKG